MADAEVMQSRVELDPPKTKWVAYLMSQLGDQNLVLIGPRMTGEARLGKWAGGTLGEPADGSVLGCCNFAPTLHPPILTTLGVSALVQHLPWTW